MARPKLGDLARRYKRDRLGRFARTSSSAPHAAGRHRTPDGGGKGRPAEASRTTAAVRSTVNEARVKVIQQGLRTSPDHDPHDPGMAGPNVIGGVHALREAGAAIDGEIRRRARKKTGTSRTALRKELRARQNKAFDANQRLDEIDDRGGPATVEERREVADLRRVVDDAAKLGRDTEQRLGELDRAEQDAQWEVLRELRPMGGTFTLQGGNRKGRKAVEDAAQFLPSEWIDRSNTLGPLAVTANDDRGGHRVSLGGVSTITTNSWNSADGSYRATTVHELTHRAEFAYAPLRTAEWGFWTDRNSTVRDGRRVWTNPPVSMADLAPHYGANEMTRRDDFVNPYMGKIYPDSRDGRARAFEVASMGAEVLAAGADYASDDQDLRHFLLGTWAVL